MRYKYSPQTGGWYIVGIHKNIPSDAIDVPTASYRQWADGGKRIVINEKGEFSLVDEPASAI